MIRHYKALLVMVGDTVETGQHHWPGWLTDLDSNLDQTRMWPHLIKVEASAEAYISGTTSWFCVSYN